MTNNMKQICVYCSARDAVDPLYIDAADVDGAVAIIADVMNNRLWDTPEYKIRAAVT